MPDLHGRTVMRIVYLPPIPFDGLKQRPQYIAEGLAQEHEVVYIDPTASMMKFLLNGGDKPAGYSYQAGEQLHVVRLNGSVSAHRSFEAISGLFRLPEQVQMNKYLKAADMVWVGYCPWFGLIKSFSGNIIYDKMDDDLSITTNPLMKKLILKVEPALIKRANRIFVTAHKFQEDIAAMGKQPVLLPNAVNGPEFEKIPEPRPKSSERIFGYVGMISHWFDTEAVTTILEADQRNRVVLVGPSEITLPMHERLTWIGRVPKEDVAGWISSFDVCLYPFKKTPFLDTIDPVKIYEYLAMNKPVLAVQSRETEKFGELVQMYRTIEELQNLAVEMPSAAFAEEEKRWSFVRENSWTVRMNTIRQVICEGPPRN